MVGDNHVALAHAFARLVEGALLEVWAIAGGALSVVGGQLAPLLVFDHFWPTVAVAIPAVAGQLIDHLLIQRQRAFIDFDAKAFVSK